MNTVLFLQAEKEGTRVIHIESGFHYFENHASSLGHLYSSVWWLLSVLAKAVAKHPGYKCVQCTVVYHPRWWLSTGQQGCCHANLHEDFSMKRRTGLLRASSSDFCLPDYRSVHMLCNSLQVRGQTLAGPCSHMVLSLKSRTCCLRHLLYLFTFPTSSWHYLNSSEMYVMIVSDTGDKEVKGSRTPADIYQMQWRTYFRTFFSKWKGQRGRKKGDLFMADKC